MKAKERRREMIFDIVRNQMKNDDPPETYLTFRRLRDMGEYIHGLPLVCNEGLFGNRLKR
jgi:hypothetical protein